MNLLVPIHSAVCPCCASSLVELARAAGHPLGPFVWSCAWCGYSMMGLAVPLRPELYAGRMLTCLEAAELSRPRNVKYVRPSPIDRGVP